MRALTDEAAANRANLVQRNDAACDAARQEITQGEGAGGQAQVKLGNGFIMKLATGNDFGNGRPASSVWGANMRTLVAGLAVLAMVIVAQPADAARWDFRPGVQAQRSQDGGGKRGGRDAREERRAPPAQPDRSTGRLTDEERRELRRDVDRANREIYRRSQK